MSNFCIEVGSIVLSQKVLLGRLNELVGEKHVVAGNGVSPYAVDGKVPQAIAFPASVEEVSAIMILASAEGLRVAPRGSGTKMTFGAVPEGVDLVLGLSRLNALVNHEPADMTATFQAGILLREAQEVLGRSGQFIALDPPYADRATLGGILATNSSGPRRLRYGSARDLLIAIRVVQADGKVIKGGAKVVKSVSGYEVVVPKEQGCCGSLLVHEGARERGKGLARKTIDVFERAGVDMIAVNAAGCGSVMKEYWELFHSDRAYSHKAEAFSKKVRDVSQILAQQPMEGRLGELNLTTT